MRLPNPRRYQSIAAASPEVVEQRRMEQMGQIAHRVQGAVGDRPRIVQQCAPPPPASTARWATASSTLMAVRTWPTSSCSSRAMLRRSSSWALMSLAESRCSSRAFSSSLTCCAQPLLQRPAYSVASRPMPKLAPGRTRGSARRGAAWRRRSSAMRLCCWTNALRLSAWTSSETRITTSRFGTTCAAENSARLGGRTAAVGREHVHHGAGNRRFRCAAARSFALDGRIENRHVLLEGLDRPRDMSPRAGGDTRGAAGSGSSSASRT